MKTNEELMQWLQANRCYADVHRLVAGAAYDLMGYLTSRKESITLSGSEMATPAVDALVKWAETVGLSLRDPDIEHWRDKLHPAPTQQAEPVAVNNKELAFFLKAAQIPINYDGAWCSNEFLRALIAAVKAKYTSQHPAPKPADPPYRDALALALHIITWEINRKELSNKSEILENLDNARKQKQILIDALQQKPADEQPVGESETIAHVTKAILFADCGNTEDWPDNLDLGEAAVKAMRQHIQRWRDDAFEASAVLAERHDCPACADDIRALKATPRPADPDLLALVDELSDVLNKPVMDINALVRWVQEHADDDTGQISQWKISELFKGCILVPARLSVLAARIRKGVV